MEQFDWKYYINRYSDLRDNGVVNRKRAYIHWMRQGRHENRYPNRQAEEKQKNQNNNNNSYLSINNDSMDTISLKDIKSIYSSNKIEYSKSEHSEIQNYNNVLIEETGEKVQQLIDNFQYLFNEIKTINKRLEMLDISNKIASKPTASDSLPTPAPIKKKVKVDEGKKSSFEDKIVSSDEYEDIEINSEENEIKYSNSDEYSNESENYCIISPSHKDLKFMKISDLEYKNETIDLPIENIDKKKKKVSNNNIIDSLINDTNIVDKRRKQKKLKLDKNSIITLSQNASSEESSEDYDDDKLKDIKNIEHKSILKKILNTDDIAENDNKTEKNSGDKSEESSIISYLKNDKNRIIDGGKLNKLINNIKSKK